MDPPSEQQKQIVLKVESVIDPEIQSNSIADLEIQSNSIIDLEIQSIEELDLTDTFTTDMVFDTRPELIKWAQQVGRTVGTVIVIKKSDGPDSGRRPRITLGCERGGKYREAKKRSGKNPSSRRTSTKRCGCPFALKGIKLPEGDQWKVKVECGFHNHPRAKHFEGHSYAGKLNDDEKAVLVEMSKSGVKPRDVLRILKERDSTNASTLMTIYNARSKMKLSKIAGRSHTKQLMNKLDESGVCKTICGGTWTENLEAEIEEFGEDEKVRQAQEEEVQDSK